MAQPYIPIGIDASSDGQAARRLGPAHQDVQAGAGKRSTERKQRGGRRCRDCRGRSAPWAGDHTVGLRTKTAAGVSRGWLDDGGGGYTRQPGGGVCRTWGLAKSGQVKHEPSSGGGGGGREEEEERGKFPANPGCVPRERSRPLLRYMSVEAKREDWVWRTETSSCCLAALPSKQTASSSEMPGHPARPLKRRLPRKGTDMQTGRLDDWTTGRLDDGQPTGRDSRLQASARQAIRRQGGSPKKGTTEERKRHPFPYSHCACSAWAACPACPACPAAGRETDRNPQPPAGSVCFVRSGLCGASCFFQCCLAAWKVEPRPGRMRLLQDTLPRLAGGRCVFRGAGDLSFWKARGGGTRKGAPKGDG